MVPEVPPAHGDADVPKPGTCPVCGRASDPVLRPFCSKRCADVDLHRWLSGGYRIPGDEEPDPEGDEAPLDDPRAG